MHRNLNAFIFMLLFALIGTPVTAIAADNPFEGFWRSKNGTVVQIQTDQGVVIRSDEPLWQAFVNQISIKNIRQEAGQWIADEWVLTDTNQGEWLVVQWRLEGETIIRTYTYNDVPTQSYFSRITETEAKHGASAYPAAPTSMALLPRHSWLVGAELSHINYEEPDVMEQEGVMYGIRGAYTYHNQIMFKAEARISYGQVDYTSNGTGAMDNIDDHLVEVRMLWGYDLPIDTNAAITPYIGFGYRFLKDDSQGMMTTTGYAGYLREANYYYSPIGLAAIAQMKNNWALEALIEYDYFWRGIQYSYFSGIDPGFNDLRNVQSKGYGARLAIDLHKQFSSVHLVFGPFVRYWSIDDSEVDLLYYNGAPFDIMIEPENTSTEYGLHLSFQF